MAAISGKDLPPRRSAERADLRGRRPRHRGRPRTGRAARGGPPGRRLAHRRLPALRRPGRAPPYGQGPRPADARRLHGARRRPRTRRRRPRPRGRAPARRPLPGYVGFAVEQPGLYRAAFCLPRPAGTDAGAGAAAPERQPHEPEVRAFALLGEALDALARSNARSGPSARRRRRRVVGRARTVTPAARRAPSAPSRTAQERRRRVHPRHGRHRDTRSLSLGSTRTPLRCGRIDGPYG